MSSHRSAATALCLALAALLAQACTGGGLAPQMSHPPSPGSTAKPGAGGPPTNPAVTRVAGAMLFPVDPVITEACRYAQGTFSFRVLCPSVLPRPFVGSPPPPAVGVAANVWRPYRHLDRQVILDFGYNGPVEGGYPGWKADLWRNHPCCFLHFEVMNEVFLEEHGWHSPEARPAAMGGRTGWYEPAGESNWYWRNHSKFYFTEAGVHYVASLHSWGSRTKDVLEVLVGGLRTVTAARPVPTVLPNPCEVSLGGTICRPDRVASVAAGDGGVWLVRPREGEVQALDVSTGGSAGDPIKVGRWAGSGLAVGAGSLWATGWSRRQEYVARVDPSSRRLIATIPVPGVVQGHLAVGSGAVWATTSANELVRIDPRTEKVTATVAVGGGAGWLAVDEDTVWVVNTADGTVSRIDPSTNRVRATIRVGPYPQGIAAGDGSVWVANSGDSTVSRIDPSTNRVAATIEVGLSPEGASFYQGAVWVANFWDGTVSKIEPAIDSVVIHPIEAGVRPFAVAGGEGAIWVSNGDPGGLVRIEAAP